MKIYLVGGAVRDTLLGLDPKDRDYVVVGSTEQEMLTLGFQKVGASFPVFLKDGEEYALARTERKVSRGYHGFDVQFDSSITLEDDLSRRDLTINSMAMDLETNELIDLFGGQEDLNRGILKHTSEAFREDPIRVLRIARFAARYSFSIHEDTKTLMAKVAPELDTVPPERIWTEFQKGLMEKCPHKMILALRECGAFQVESMKPYGGAQVPFLMWVHPSDDIVVRFGLICNNFNPSDYEQCRIPSDCADVAMMLNKHLPTLLTYLHLSAEQRLALLQDLKVFNRLWLFEKVMSVFEFYRGYTPVVDDAIKQIMKDVHKVRAVDSAAIAASCSTGAEIKEKLFEARLATL